MSPVASGGPPHTRATPAHGGGPVGTANGIKSPSMDGLKGGDRVYPHLDDLVGTRPSVNIHSPFRTILELGDSLAKQAESHLDFRRPDIALQEYVQATIIAVEILPRHKDYSALQGDRPELYRSYMGLNKRINAQHGRFAEVKEMIKENNLRHGVKPVVEGITSKTGSMSLSNGEESRTHREATNGAPNGKRAPPPVQPKPNALHGKSLSNGTPPADLAARFARLRSPEQNIPVQDPRIRTQPIIIPGMPSTAVATSTPPRNSSSISRPTGPREMPSVPTTNPQQPKISVDVKVSGMPRPPDAIYSPDRGTESEATANLRSSSSLSNVRKYGAPPISTVGPSPLLVENRREYFSAAHTTSDTSSQRPLKRKQPSLPDSTTISAEDLMGYIGQGSQSLRVLLVDVRSREDFDSGHIMSQSIICVEPITLRYGISGEQLGDTMAVAPDAEQELYEQRHDFDLVVAYDQASTSLDTSVPTSGGNSKIQDFMLAVYDYGYEKRLKRRPVLLRGGLNSWIDLLGPSALKSTDPGSSALPNQAGKSSQSLSRAMALRNSSANDRSKRRTFRQLTSQEQNYWETTLSPKGPQSEDTVADDFSYAKTTEDFFRRYPELPSLQQSMVSSAERLALEHQKLENELRSMSSTPPTRPAPALPRQRSSGIISDRRMMTNHAHTAPNDTITSGYRIPPLTGLKNSGVSCYINSVIQALSASVYIRNLLRSYQHPPSPPIPLKLGEVGNYCPQLMVRCFGNLLGHLWSGRYDYVAPTTFLAYCASIDDPSKGKSEAFGALNGVQQDASEFYIFLTSKLEDELNPQRNGPMYLSSQEQQELDWAPERMSAQAACDRARDFFFKFRRSPMSQMMDSVVYQKLHCRACNHVMRKWTCATYLEIQLVEYRLAPHTFDLLSQLQYMYGSEELSPLAFDCKQAGCSGATTKDTYYSTRYLTHMPEYLTINLSRFVTVAQGPKEKRTGFSVTKMEDAIKFNEELDLSACFPRDFLTPGQQRPQRGPFIYEVYAVIRHSGSTIGGGHYTTIARHLDQPASVNGKPGAGAWHLYNDKENIIPLSKLSGESGEIWHRATMIFLKRKGAPTKPRSAP